MKKYKLRIRKDKENYFWVDRKRFNLFWTWEKCFWHKELAEEYIKNYCQYNSTIEKPIIVRCECK